MDTSLNFKRGQWKVLRQPRPWTQATSVSGMAGGAVQEATTRIAGAARNSGIPEPEVAIQINLRTRKRCQGRLMAGLTVGQNDAPGRWSFAGLTGASRGRLRAHGRGRVTWRAAHVSRGLSPLPFSPGQVRRIIVPSGNEKECALILAKPGHEGCNVFAVSTLEEVFEFFQGRRKLENALRETIQFESGNPQGHRLWPDKSKGPGSCEGSGDHIRRSGS